MIIYIQMVRLTTARWAKGDKMEQSKLEIAREYFADTDSIAYLEDIIAHGIHNITEHFNDLSESQEDYDDWVIACATAARERINQLNNN